MMFRSLLCVLALCQCFAGVDAPSFRAALAMKTGVLLRLHVIAQDDTEEMQRVKLCVRDAVRASYASGEPDETLTMAENARRMLPELTQAAQSTALAEGFTGSVTVALEQVAFDQREDDGLTIPAGSYPALMVRLGEARGHNCWGLLDPTMSLSAACAGGEGAIVWDWSPEGFFQALRALFQPAGLGDPTLTPTQPQ